MSCSSLWAVDKNHFGEELKEYGNSWLFSPIAWNVLLDKYLHDEIQTPYGYKKSLISAMDGGALNNQLNKIVNNCTTFCDRIVWELSNQQVFYAKDKKIVADGIRRFLDVNSKYNHNDEGKFPLEQEHIKARWLEIADNIENLTDECEYFIFKNSSCDDGVEYWFEKYNEESEEYEPSSLKEIDKYVTEFVTIDGETMKFTSNLEFFNKEAKE